ncbi:MAG: hypothetical protein M1812_007332 [Candelaria pacifica]|nr:MAG: hypothetical protein M1812_007332 [Candelaria pacifica]
MVNRTQEGSKAVLRIVACSVDDHYEILGLDFPAERLAIIKAYQRLSLLVHPDKCGDPRAKDAMQRLNNSKAWLTDPDLKADYDYRRANRKPRPAQAPTSSGNDPGSSSPRKRSKPKPEPKPKPKPEPKPKPRPKPKPQPRIFGEFDQEWRHWEEGYQERWAREHRAEEGAKMPPRVIITNLDGQPLVEFEVIPTGKLSNSLWRAFALAYHFDTDRWAEVKLQVSNFFLKVVSDKGHPRWALYNALNKEARKEHRTSLSHQLTQRNEKATPELFQVLADLFSVELMVLVDNTIVKDVPFHTMIPRGQNGDRQVFLHLPSPDRYDVLRMRSSVKYPKWYAHMDRTYGSDDPRCPLPGWMPDGKEYYVPEPLKPRPKVEKVDPKKVRRWANRLGAQE